MRNIAIKCCIRQLLAGRFVQTAEGIQYYIGEEQPAGRINLIAALVGKEETGKITSLLLDDGTGQIIARLFEEPVMKNILMIGETVLVIGKMRLFGQERYISPEIVKHLDTKWMVVRKKELEKTAEENIEIIQEKMAENPAGIIREETIEVDSVFPGRKVLEIIKAADQGSGVPVEDVLQQCPFSRGEEIIRTLQSQGLIFEITPGKVKVL